MRAYRDLGGTVHLTLARAATQNPTPENPAPPDENRRLSGPDLASVAPLSCQAVLSHGGSANSDFSTYHWSEWLAAPYRLPGSNTVHALVHTEFHGADFNRPDLCTYGSSQPALGLSWCWLSAITSAVSSDGGASFEHAQTPPAHLVANIPYQYEKDSGATGFRAPTNIVRRSEPGGDFYYMMFDASQFSKGSFAAENMQQSGACIMRTNDLSSPSSWRAWDGNSADDTQGGFTVQFQYPFPIEPVAGGLCTPLDETRPVPLSNTLVPRGLSFNSYFDRYMLVGNRTTTEPDGTTFFYVYYLLSDDLVHWSAPNLIMRAPTIAQYRADGCSGPDVPVVYPTVMDRDDASTNFERTSQTADLYYLRRGDINPNGCTNNFPGFNHELTRVPIRFGSAREATGRPLGCSGSFDSSTRRSAASSFVSQQGSSYSGDPRSYTGDGACCRHGRLRALRARRRAARPVRAAGRRDAAALRLRRKRRGHLQRGLRLPDGRVLAPARERGAPVSERGVDAPGGPGVGRLGRHADDRQAAAPALLDQRQRPGDQEAAAREQRRPAGP